MGTQVSFIFRGYSPYIGGSKPSFFMGFGVLMVDNSKISPTVGPTESTDPWAPEYPRGPLGFGPTLRILDPPMEGFEPV